MGLLAACRELVEVGRLLDHAHHALLVARVLTALVVLTDGVALELIDTAGDGLDLHRVLNPLVHDHLVPGALRGRRVRVTVHAHELVIPVGCPLPGRSLLGQRLVAAAQRRGAPVVTAAHHLEVDLGIAAELAAPQVLSLVLHDHLLEQVVLLVDGFLDDGLGGALAGAAVLLLAGAGRIRGVPLDI